MVSRISHIITRKSQPFILLLYLLTNEKVKKVKKVFLRRCRRSGLSIRSPDLYELTNSANFFYPYSLRSLLVSNFLS